MMMVNILFRLILWQNNEHDKREKEREVGTKRIQHIQYDLVSKLKDTGEIRNTNGYNNDDYEYKGVSAIGEFFSYMKTSPLWISDNLILSFSLSHHIIIHRTPISLHLLHPIHDSDRTKYPYAPNHIGSRSFSRQSQPQI